MPIYIRITVAEVRAELSTKRYIDPNKWNSNSQKAIGSSEEVKQINSYIKTLEQDIYSAHQLLVQQGKTITAESIKNQVLGKDETTHMLIEIFKNHNRKMAALVGKEFSKGTLERYETSLRHTQEFLRYHLGVSDIDIKKINNELISEYDFYLRSVRNCGNNSAVKYISNFGKIIRICRSNGWISLDPFANYSGKLKIIERVYLSDEELQRITDKEFATERLTQIRDVFVFCCLTGLV